MNKKGKILMVAGLVCFGACVFAGPPRHHHNEGLELANGIVDLVCRVLKPAPVVVAPAPAPVVEEVVEEEEVFDEEIIAVIAAAIAAFDQTNAKLVVRSVRRKGAWGKASREEQVYRF